MDETYIKVKEHWHDFCRAVEPGGKTLDLMLCRHRDLVAARTVSNVELSQMSH